jgi:hypothetical protein
MELRYPRFVLAAAVTMLTAYGSGKSDPPWVRARA